MFETRTGGIPFPLPELLTGRGKLFQKISDRRNDINMFKGKLNKTGCEQHIFFTGADALVHDETVLSPNRAQSAFYLDAVYGFPQILLVHGYVKLFCKLFETMEHLLGFHSLLDRFTSILSCLHDYAVEKPNGCVILFKIRSIILD